jgi:hypothetical protein
MDYFLVPQDSFGLLSVASVMMRSSDTLADIARNSILSTDIITSGDLQNFVMTSCSETMVPFQSETLHLLRNEYSPKVMI